VAPPVSAAVSPAAWRTRSFRLLTRMMTVATTSTAMTLPAMIQKIIKSTRSS
jgi:hypothetical protein